ncbi:enoyl-CoA hydratase/isomerase family protein [Paraconexibacter sp.]|uniref:enoyl-CoA hydratase/isomerase family protein n=1 Tax=Paraconexibacter sp. TaxID=2949640 RepID=UPI003563C7DA
MSADARVGLSVDDRVGLAELRLERPDAGNAIDPAWVSAFRSVVEQIAVRAEDGGDGRVRAVLISAAGSAFTVGGDLRHFAAHREDLAAELNAMVPPFHDALLRLAELPVPVVAAVQGPVAGGGLGLAWCSDVVLAAPQARFATGFHLLGLSGDGASSWWLPRLVGLRRAQQMLLQGRVLDADEALEWGLISEVVPSDELAARARSVAVGLAEGPTLALGRIRALLRDASETTLAEHYAREAREIVACGDTRDAVEGTAAFAERRPPEFRGR